MKILPLIVLMMGCAAAGPKASSEEISAYLADLREHPQPTKISVPKAESAVAWKRTRDFIEKYSSMSIRAGQDENMIETFTPGETGLNGISLPSSSYGYAALRAPGIDKDSISIKCSSSRASDDKDSPRGCSTNEQILVRFIKSGTLPHPQLIAR